MTALPHANKGQVCNCALENVSNVKKVKISTMIIAVNTADMLLFNLKCKVNIIFSRKKADYLHEGFAHLGERNGNYSSILAWKTPCTEEPGGLQSMGSQELDMT